MFTSLLMEMINDTDEQPDEEIQRVWEGYKLRSSCPSGIEVCHPSGMDMLVCQPESPPGLEFLGFYVGFLT